MKKKEKPKENQRRKPVQARSMKRYQAILEALPQVLVRLGYDKMTTDEIALEADVAIGSLYQYFRNKDDVIAAYMDEQLKELCQVILDEVNKSRADESNQASAKQVSAIDVSVTSAVEFVYDRIDVMYAMRRDFQRFVQVASESYLVEQIQLVAKGSDYSNGNEEPDFMLAIRVISYAGIGLMAGLVLSNPPHDKELVIREMTLLIKSHLSARLGFEFL